MDNPIPVSETIKYSDGSEKVINFQENEIPTIVSESMKEDESSIPEVSEENETVESTEVSVDPVPENSGQSE